MTGHTAPTLPEFDKLWNFNNVAETEQKFRAILPLTEDPENLDYRLQLLTQIARTQGLQRKFIDAHETLNKVEELLTKDTLTANIRYNLERGRVFNSSTEKDKALTFFRQAFRLADEAKSDNLAIDAAHMMAIAEASSEEQMAWNLKALEKAEKSTDDKAKNWSGSLYNNIGWTYHDQGKFDDALKMFQKALAFREEKKDPKTIRIAKWCVARTYRSLNQIDHALEIQKSLETELNQLSEKDGYIFEELGELYLLKSLSTEVEKYFTLAFHELSKDDWFKAHEPQRLARIKDLGKVN